MDPELLATFDKLGIPLNEQKRLANVAVDAVFDSVSIATTFKEELKKVRYGCWGAYLCVLMVLKHCGDCCSLVLIHHAPILLLPDAGGGHLLLHQRGCEGVPRPRAQVHGQCGKFPAAVHDCCTLLPYYWLGPVHCHYSFCCCLSIAISTCCFSICPLCLPLLSSPRPAFLAATLDLCHRLQGVQAMRPWLAVRLFART